MNHLAALTNSLADEGGFAAAFDAIKSLNAVELKALAREFTGRPATSKANALHLISNRHTSLLAAGRRNLVTSGRSAA